MQLHRQMARLSDALAAVVELSRIRFRERDEILDRLRGTRRRHDEDVRRRADVCDRQDLLLEVCPAACGKARAPPHRRSDRRAAYNRRGLLWPPAAVAIVFPAPGRFSTITGCFQISLSRVASTRPTASVGPPAAGPIRSRTGRSGYAPSALQAVAAANTRKHDVANRSAFMLSRSLE